MYLKVTGKGDLPGLDFLWDQWGYVEGVEIHLPSITPLYNNNGYKVVNESSIDCRDCITPCFVVKFVDDRFYYLPLNLSKYPEVSYKFSSKLSALDTVYDYQE